MVKENFLKHDVCIKRKKEKCRRWSQCLKLALKCLILHGNQLGKNAKNKSQYSFAFIFIRFLIFTQSFYDNRFLAYYSSVEYLISDDVKMNISFSLFINLQVQTCIWVCIQFPKAIIDFADIKRKRKMNEEQNNLFFKFCGHLILTAASRLL